MHCSTCTSVLRKNTCLTCIQRSQATAVNASSLNISSMKTSEQSVMSINGNVNSLSVTVFPTPIYFWSFFMFCAFLLLFLPMSVNQNCHSIFLFMQMLIYSSTKFDFLSIIFHLMCCACMQFLQFLPMII